MKKTNRMLVVFGVAALAVVACRARSQTLPRRNGDAWEKIKDGKQAGISGVDRIGTDKAGRTFLIIHDNKKAKQQKLAILRVQKNKKTQYTPIAWPRAAQQPVDLEAVCSVPGKRSNEFLAATSSGDVFHLRLAQDKLSVEVLKQFRYPDRKGKNFEGLDLYRQGTALVAVWAHRGKGRSSAILFWGLLDLASGRFSNVGSKKLHVPWPAGENTRSVSDLKIDMNGGVYVSAASDPGDDGPFDSALYSVGRVVTSGGRKLAFRMWRQPKEVKRLPKHKVEAIVLLRDRPPVFLVGTDDENRGSSICTVRADL